MLEGRSKVTTAGSMHTRRQCLWVLRNGIRDSLPVRHQLILVLSVVLSVVLVLVTWFKSYLILLLYTTAKVAKHSTSY